MNYGELKQAIQDYTVNSEATFVTHINDFIIAAEDRIFGAIDLPQRWYSTTVTPLIVNTSEYTIDSTLGALDILSVRISEVDTGQESDVSFGPVRYLIQKDYDFLLEAYPGSDSEQKSGVPKYYAISSYGSAAETSAASSSVTVRLGPSPSVVSEMTITYYGKPSNSSVTNGSVSATTTWMSSNFPDVLLYGALLQANVFMKGEPDITEMYDKMFMEGLLVMKNLLEKRSTGDDFRPTAPPLTPPQAQGR